MEIKKIIRKNITEAIYGIVIGLWMLAIIIKFLNDWKNGDIGALLLYGQIALTLFGITLIGGIFENRENQLKVEIKLFDSSLIFLTSAICLFIAYVLASFFPDPQATIDLFSLESIGATVFTIALLIGFLGITTGFIQLYRILKDYRLNLTNKS